ncbi:hypothetical protein D3C85_1648990 [compost metagenome]
MEMGTCTAASGADKSNCAAFVYGISFVNEYFIQMHIPGAQAFGVLDHDVVAVVNVFSGTDDFPSSCCKYRIILMRTEINARMITRYFSEGI